MDPLPTRLVGPVSSLTRGSVQRQFPATKGSGTRALLWRGRAQNAKLCSSSAIKGLLYNTRMPPSSQPPVTLPKAAARRIWLRAQRLDVAEPFGDGPNATRAAIEHLGYVQIDTINVIERSHHHILWTRIPGYLRAHLRQAQSIEKSVFEYWTHALSYVPTRDMPFFLPEMSGIDIGR